MSVAVATVGDILSVEQAREGVLGTIDRTVEVEVIATADALGRVLAGPVRAATALPPWDNSAMDGYAIRSEDVATATEDNPVRLDVVGEARAGSQPDAPVSPGRALRIATGAPLPWGADAVVPVELTTPLGPDDEPSGPRGRDATGPLPAACLVHQRIPIGGSIRRAGSDIAADTILLDGGSSLTAAGIALSAGAGVPRVAVHRRVRVAVLATGDEVRGPDEPMGPAGIPDANGPGLRALVTASGADAIDLGIARDLLDDVSRRLEAGISAGADVIIVSGGVSVGPYDVVKTAFDALGQIDLWRVAVQPGKPFTFGTAPRPGGRGSPVLLFGLPGNPVSSFVTFELFVRPAVRRLAGQRSLLRPVDRGVLRERVSKSAGRRAFIRVVADRDPAGAPVRDSKGRVSVRLAGGQAGQGSHVLSALAVADALAVVPEVAESVRAGTAVDLWWLDRD
ncbi:MAG TPA: gephyrin-like molybdotransferase Glp [Candidatus Limnocylindrales bacterium]|jgi:molybdenum cofactor synthesis domain-containing protein